MKATQENAQVVLIDGNSLKLASLTAIAQGAKVVMSKSVMHRVRQANRYLKAAIKKNEPIYGVNTGMGFLANKRIHHKRLLALQENLIRSHSAGYGALLSNEEVRMIMALRLNTLVKGHSGVRYRLCEALYALIQEEIYPLIPEHGSVGSGGDLVPLAHMSLALMGEGYVSYKGKIVLAKEALEKAKLSSLRLAEKEGLALINGTQASLATGGLALENALLLIDIADHITALTYEAFSANPEPLHPLIHEERGQLGQIKSAQTIYSQLHKSYLFYAQTKHLHLQDPYSIRCAPQIHGASRDAMMYARGITELELNALVDNPLIFPDHHLILNGGNFHGQPLAMAFDVASLALAEIGSVSQRRLELLLNPQYSGLPPFLAKQDGLQCGLMASQYLDTSLVNENKLLANPSVTDSSPGNVGIEDHVSTGMISGRKLKRIVENIKAILAVEWLAGAQAIDMRKIKQLGVGTKKLYQELRKEVPKLTKDRILAEDIQKTVNLINRKLAL